MFGGWLDEKSKTVYIQDVDYKATGKGKERVIDGVLEVDAQTEQEAIEAALCCVGNLG